jgi:hypothetical protein
MQSYFNLSRHLSYKKASLPALVSLALGALLASSVQAAGTDVSTPVQNSVTLSYQVNSVGQTASTSVTFNVDRKLVLDVTSTDAGWVPVVPSQDVSTPGASLPALNFTVTNSSNDATNIVLGLIDQDGNAVTGFSAPGTAFANTPGAVVVAIDDGGNPATPVSDGVYTQGVDTLLTVGANGVYSLGNLPIDATANVIVAISVDGTEANNVYRSYTLVAGVADAGGEPFTPTSLDDSGNIAPASGATPNEATNGLATVETVWADAGAPAANLDDEQFDFFSATSGLGVVDGIADGQSSDASGFTTRVALSLAKSALVLYDPITGNRFNSDRVTVDAEPKAIPGAVIMYVIGVANESATLAANAVTLNDTLPVEVVAGDQANPAAAIVIPNAASFAVGGVTPSFDLSGVTDLDVVSHSACSTPASDPAYIGAPISGVGGDVGNCAASATAYIVYFVTLD